MNDKPSPPAGAAISAPQEPRSYRIIAEATKRLVEWENNFEITVDYWPYLGGEADLKQHRIKVPRPVGRHPLFVYLHELAHLGLGLIRPVCLGELKANQFAFDVLTQFGIRPTAAILMHHRRYMALCLAKALNHGLRMIPDELKGYQRDVRLAWLSTGPSAPTKRYFALVPMGRRRAKSLPRQTRERDSAAVSAPPNAACRHALVMRLGAARDAWTPADAETNEFGRLLCLVRLRWGLRGMSQTELARRVGVTTSYISRLEQGARLRPGRDVILLIQRALNLSDRQTNALLDAAFYPSLPEIDEEYDGRFRSRGWGAPKAS